MALGFLAAAAAIYLASPFWALYRLHEAVQRGDVATLAAAVDWDAVREGLKEDICDEITGEPEPQHDAKPRVQTISHADALPAFGASFVAGMASNMVDQVVTPEGLANALRQRAPGPGDIAHGTAAEASPFAMVGIGWSFFDGPTSFNARLRASGETPDDPPVVLHMELVRGAWRLTRVTLPPSLLTQVQSHT